jgi:hypothetical protein
VVFFAILIPVAIGIHLAVRRYRSRSPIAGEALLHLQVPPAEGVARAARVLEDLWSDRAVSTDVVGGRASVSTPMNPLTFGEDVCVVVRAHDGGSALSVSSTPRHFAVLIDYGRNTRNVRRVADRLVEEGAVARYPY